MNLKFATAALVSTTAALQMLSVAMAEDQVSDEVIAEQREMLAKSTDGAGFGPQSPRDIDALGGDNNSIFSDAPAYTEMNLCTIHFHEGAEHRGGEFTNFAGNGKGYGTGFVYSGTLTEAELAPLETPIGDKGHDGLEPGVTIEVHYVHTTGECSDRDADRRSDHGGKTSTFGRSRRDPFVSWLGA